MEKFQIFCMYIGKVIMDAIVRHKRGVASAVIILMFWPGVYYVIKQLFRVGELMTP